jgi:hypothetical protein
VILNYTLPSSGAWAFDSGLSGPMRTVVRNAFIARLAPMTVAGGGWLSRIVPIGYTIKDRNDDLGIDNLYATLNGQTPAIAVATAKLVDDPAGAADRDRGRLTVDLYFMSQHRRDLTEGRTSPDAASTASRAADPGLDAALELAWMYLLGGDLGVGPQIGLPRFLEEDEIIADNDKTIWYQTWQVIVTRDANQLRNAVTKLTQMHATLKPTGDEPAPLHTVVDTDV